MLYAFLWCGTVAQAQQVLNWSQTDLGNSGTYSVSSGQYTIGGAGTGIPTSGSSALDSFNFSSRQTIGDVEMIVYVASQSSGTTGAAAGIAIRESVNSNAAGAFITVTPSGGANFTYRSGTGAAASTSNQAGVSAPTWLRLVRSGNSFSAYVSSNGTSWTQVGSAQTLTLPATAYTGFAVSSGSTSLNTAVFENVTLLAGQTQVDIGTTGSIGTYSYNTGTATRTIGGAGAGQTGTSDSFNYVSYPGSDGVSFTAYVGSLTGATANGLAGLTARASTSANSAEATMGITPSGGVRFIARSSTGATVTVVNQAGTPSAAPIWLRLTQSGSTWTGWYSTNGSSWTNFASASITLPSPPSTFLMGFATYSGGTSLATATYSNVTLTRNQSFNQQDVSNTGTFALEYDIQGAGAGLSGTSDSFSYVAMPTNGPVSMTVHVASQSGSPSGAVAGLMARDSLNANGAHAFVGATAGGNVQFIYRATSGGGTTTVDSGSTDSWIRLTQSGSTFTAYRSANGTSWTSIGSASITMPSSYYEGLAVSGSSGSLSSATFDNISMGQIGDLAQTDIGSPGATGTFAETFTVQGDGSGVGGTSDNLNFSYIPANGNLELIVKVDNLQNPVTSPSNYAIGGIMIKESLNANSAMAMVTVSPAIGGSPGNGVNFSYRTSTGAAAQTILGPSLAAPVWLKLVRSGSSFAGYQSADGINWSLVGSSTMTMSSNTFVGITVSSNSPGNLETATITMAELIANVPQRSSSLAMWLRADSGVANVSNAVSQWDDQSTNGNNAYQSSSSQKPTLIPNGLSGMPVLSFDGSADNLQLGTDFKNLSGGMTAFVVAKPVSVAGTQYLIDFGNSTSSDNILFGVTTGSASTVTTYRGISSAALTSSAGGANVGKWQLLECTIDAANNATLLNNGTSFGTGAVLQLNNVNRAGNYIGQRTGGTNFFNGQIAEMFFYTSPVSAATRTAIQSYVYSKYGIGTQPTLSAPTITPGYGIYSSQQQITISADSGAQIFYTLDGSTPTQNSTPYTGPFSLSSTTTIKAIAIQPYFANSAVASAQIIIDESAATVALPGLMMWLRSDTGVSTSGSDVTSWNDLSGAGNTATQTISSARPNLVNNAVNGLPAVSFDGTSEYMRLPSGFANFPNGVTMFLMVNPTFPTQLYHPFLHFEDASNSVPFSLSEYSSGGLIFHNTNGSFTSVLASGALTTGSYQLVECVFNGSNTGTLYINGTQVQQSTSMNSISNTTRTNNFLMNTSGGGLTAGSLAEVIMYSTALNTSQRQAIESYLLARYGIQVNPPIITPASGIYAGAPQTVTITAPPGVTVYYTTDGTVPTTSSPVYAGSFPITQSTTVQAFSKAGAQQSSVARADIAIDANAINVPTSGLNLWLRNDVGITTSGSSVLSWGDISGNNNIATQTSAGNRPTVTTLNSIPCVNFNGSSQYLTLPSGFANFTTGMSAFVVTAPTSVTANARWFDFGTGSSGNNNFYLSQPNSSDSQLTIFSSTSGQSVTGSNSVTLNAFQLIEAIQSGSATGTLWTNSTQSGTGSLYNIPNTTRSTNYIGQATQGGTYFTGNIAEMLLYNRAVTAFERNIIEAYLMSRYSLQPSYPVPVFHPGNGTHFSGTLQVAITAATFAEIHYTTDGTTPTSGSPLYTAPLNLTSTTTVKAISILNGVPSVVSTATFTSP